MKGALRALALLTPFIVLIGCGYHMTYSSTPPLMQLQHNSPEVHVFDNTRTYDQSFDETWDHLINYLQKEEFHIDDADKAKPDNEGKTRGEIDATTSHYSADFADCGSYAWFDRMLGDEHFHGNIYAYVVPEGGKTKVTIDTGFLVYTLRGEFEGFLGDTFRGDFAGICTSPGALEQRILNSL